MHGVCTCVRTCVCMRMLAHAHVQAWAALRVRVGVRVRACTTFALRACRWGCTARMGSSVPSSRCCCGRWAIAHSAHTEHTRTSLDALAALATLAALTARICANCFCGRPTFP